ncbi:hypothetical protein LNP74_01145 [Klebsiella pneumoniae subsp. pneumoniae]|nr:hypothetical protein [Klebsiella pneumoniae subsp. pneumoniae]
MNRAATLTLNAPLLMLVAALALSTPFTAGAAPAFPVITPNSKPSNLRRKKKNDAASVKQTQESRQSADNKKNRYQQHLTITKKNHQPAGGDCTKR